MNYGLILAGGKGSRFGAEKNKVLLPLCGKPILFYSIKAFESAGIFDKIVIVSGENEREQVEKILRNMDIENYEIVTGGLKRQDSVINGLNSMMLDKDFDNEGIVLIHDSARPLVSVEEILSVFEAVKIHKAATLGTLVKDTIKRGDSQDFAIETLDRNELWQISTPQGFEIKLLKRAYESARKDGFQGTDDCMLVERIGEIVKLIKGSYKNIKITTFEDLKIAEVFLGL